MNETGATSAAGGALLSARGLAKSYTMGDARLGILRDLDFDVRAGETVSIMGVSGAGKTTLLHILGGLDRPSGGSVFYRGQDLYGMSTGRRNAIRARKIGFVFQTYHLLPELDVIENVMLPSMNSAWDGMSAWRERLRAAWRGVVYAGARERARRLLEAVGLAERAGHLPGELSGGEQQRAALARALMNDPEIVLADEPTGNLDAATGRQVLDRLMALVHENGKTLVMVTHNAAITRLCDRAFDLAEGRLSPFSC